MVHLEAGSRLEGAKCLGVDSVTQGVRASCSRDNGEQTEDGGDGDGGANKYKANSDEFPSAYLG